MSYYNLFCKALEISIFFGGVPLIVCWLLSLQLLEQDGKPLENFERKIQKIFLQN